MIKNANRSSRKVPVIPVRFKLQFNFLDRYSKKTQIIPNLMKIYPVAPELCRANRGTNGWTDGKLDRYDEADIRFS